MNPARALRVDSFLFEYKRWAATEAGIQAVARIDSRARNTATPEADVDLIVVVSLPNIYLSHKQWTSLFGDEAREHLEDYGNRTSFRVWYSDGLEVDFGFVDETWLARPLAEDTLKIVSGGMKVMFERKPLLSLLD
jgi:hypothetical protein